MSDFNASGVEQSDLENSLEVLQKARQAFSNHPFSSVLYGRMVYITTEAYVAGLLVPQEFSGLIGAKLQPWQDYSLNYDSPADFRSRRNMERCLPPEWRS